MEEIYNLTSSMQTDLVEPQVEEEFEPLPMPEGIDFPREILKTASDLNNANENTRHQLSCRQLAGAVHDLYRQYEASMAAVQKACDTKPEKLRVTPQVYVQETVRQAGNTLLGVLIEKVGDFDQRLAYMEKVPKVQLPSGMLPGIVTLCQTGLFHIHKKNLTRGHWQLPDEIINALGIRPDLPPPHDEFRVEQIAMQEKAIQLLESLRPFCTKLQQFKYKE